MQDPWWIKDRPLVVGPSLGEFSNMEEQKTKHSKEVIDRI